MCPSEVSVLVAAGSTMSRDGVGDDCVAFLPTLDISAFVARSE